MSDTSFALVITGDHALQKITKGGPEDILTPDNTAFDVSVCADGNIWIVSENPDTDEGGSALLYSTDGGRSFHPPGGKQVGGEKVAGTPNGSCWFIGEDRSVSTLDLSGNVEQILPAESATEIAIDAIGRVWIVSTKVNEGLGGNIVMETTIDAKDFKNITGDPVAKKITGWQDGSCWIVTPKGEVGFIELEGPTGLLSPAGNNIALSIGMSPNMGTTWIVGTEIEDQQGRYGNVIRYWDEQGMGPEHWKVVPEVEALVVSGGG